MPQILKLLPFLLQKFNPPARSRYLPLKPALRIPRQLGLIAIAHSEWCVLEHLMLGIVICELCKRQFVEPVVLVQIVVASQVVFKVLVLPFCLAISLRMVSSAKPTFTHQVIAES